MIYQLGNLIPDTTKSAYVADSAQVIGDVILHDRVTVWPNAVIRGDIATIIIGENSNVQDNSTIHIDENVPCILGKNVTVGHNVILHSCVIDDNVIVGMGSIVLNNSKVAKNCIIGAGSIVTHKLPYEEGCLVMGSPAKIVRKLTDDEIKHIKNNADHYYENGLLFKNTLKKL